MPDKNSQNHLKSALLSAIISLYLAIQNGEAGKYTVYVPSGDDTKYGVKDQSIDDIIKEYGKGKKSIFESTINLPTNVVEANLDLSGNGKYGTDIDTEDFKMYVRAAVAKASKGKADQVAPKLFWGAPGIGKTALVKQVLKEFGGKRRCIIKNLSSANSDDFSLPMFVRDDKGEIQGAGDIPKTWLPVYKVTGDPEV